LIAGLLGWFIYKTNTLYTISSLSTYYLTSKRAMTIFATCTILMAFLTLVNMITCVLNFGKRLGLSTEAMPISGKGRVKWVSLCSDLGGHMIKERKLVHNISSNSQATSPLLNDSIALGLMA
jgi:hypothetical protein